MKEDVQVGRTERSSGDLMPSLLVLRVVAKLKIPSPGPLSLEHMWVSCSSNSSRWCCGQGHVTSGFVQLPRPPEGPQAPEDAWSKVWFGPGDIHASHHRD